LGESWGSLPLRRLRKVRLDEVGDVEVLVFEVVDEFGGDLRFAAAGQACQADDLG
jgi:hypothetical protein